MSTKNGEIVGLEQGGLRENRLLQARDSTEGEWDAIDAACQDADQISAKLPANYRDTLLPDGMVIRGHFLKVETVKHLQRWVAHFMIADEPEMEEFSGLPVIRCWNVPRSGKRISPNHHLYQDYKAVTGLRGLVVPGNHGPSAVLGSFLKDVQIEAVTSVVTRSMNRRTGQWADTDADEHYSVIEKITRLTAGTPRVLQKRAFEER